jgi:hypothetical protein
MDSCHFPESFYITRIDPQSLSEAVQALIHLTKFPEISAGHVPSPILLVLFNLSLLP